MTQSICGFTETERGRGRLLRPHEAHSALAVLLSGPHTEEQLREAEREADEADARAT